MLLVLLAKTGLTQTEAAALLGVANRTVRRWLEGVCAPPAAAIDRLAALALGLDQMASAIIYRLARQSRRTGAFGPR